MNYQKLPPQSGEVETAVIGALLIDKNCLNLAMARIFPEVFYQEANSLIFESIEKVYDTGQPVDILTVMEQMKKEGSLERAGGMQYLISRTNSVLSGANIETHLLLLNEQYLKRQTTNICAEAANDALQDEKDIFDIINRTDNGLQQMQEKVLVGSAKDMSFFSMEVIKQHDEVKSTGILGISTGIEALDKSICGLVPPDLIVIAARPGQGKTAMALSITHNTSVDNDIPCLWFSLEMDGVQLTRRLASIQSGISHEILRNGSTSTDEYSTFTKAMEIISNSKIFIEDKTSINVRDIRTRANLLKKKHGIKYIVIDYIQLMHGIDSKCKNREQEVSEITRGLKCLAKELQMPVIALSQLSREVEKRPDKMPQLSDLRESGAIEQDADAVIFLMRPEYYKITEDVSIGGEDYPVGGLCIANVAKSRHGASGRNLPLHFTGRTMYFSDNKKEITYKPAGDNWKPIKD